MGGNVNIFGGGFFYKQFTRSAHGARILHTSGLGSGNPGPWASVIPVTFGGRWLELRCFSRFGGGATFNTFQLGLGPAGAETIWQPTELWDQGIAQDPALGWGFLISPAGQPNAAGDYVPSVFAFPVSVPVGTTISARTMDDTLAPQINAIHLVVWD